MLSFYYTEKVALYVKNKNPLMQTLTKIAETKYQESINSLIVDNIYIIPGKNGQEVNLDKSFSNMVSSSTYNESDLVFNEIKPTISIEDNKDKIIIRGNKSNNNISLIIEKENDLSTYLINNNYQVNLLIKEERYINNIELINNSNNKKTYNKIDNYLDKNKINSNICLIEDNNIPSLCKNKYLVKPSMIINHSNLPSLKNKISSGEIILIKDTLTISELIILLNEINYKDLSIVYLSNLISE